MNEEQILSDTFWDAHKTCGELSSEECNDRFQNLHVELASKQKEIDSLQSKLELQAPQKEPALKQHKEFWSPEDDSIPLESLRFFCSLAMSGQDWLDVEPFFDAVQKEIDELKKQLRLVALEKYENTPVDPEEVYSPNTKVINE